MPTSSRSHSLANVLFSLRHDHGSHGDAQTIILFTIGLHYNREIVVVIGVGNRTTLRIDASVSASELLYWDPKRGNEVKWVSPLVDRIMQKRAEGLSGRKKPRDWRTRVIHEGRT